MERGEGFEPTTVCVSVIGDRFDGRENAEPLENSLNVKRLDYDQSVCGRPRLPFRHPGRIGAPCQNRTDDHCLGRATLYQRELMAHGVGGRIRTSKVVETCVSA